jgi:ABC-type cobalt transport system substrate-binding protein
MQGDYEGDPAFRDAMHRWVQRLWEEKDGQIEALLAEARARS